MDCILRNMVPTDNIDRSGIGGGKPRPSVAQGDWFVTLRTLGGRCYFTPPSTATLYDAEGFPEHASAMARAPNIAEVGAYLGPVHGVEDSQWFTSILVPHPEWECMIWVNVWSCWNGRGVDYCGMVPRETTARWRDEGWQDRYLV